MKGCSVRTQRSAAEQIGGFTPNLPSARAGENEARRRRALEKVVHHVQELRCALHFVDHDVAPFWCAAEVRREKRPGGLDSAPMRDTLPEAEIVRRDAVRRLDPRERLRQALELSDALIRLRRAANASGRGNPQGVDSTGVPDAGGSG